MSEIYVGVGTTNELKLEAAKKAFEHVFKKDVIVHGFETASGVSAQPLSTEESFIGARNRADMVAQKAMSCKPEIEYAVGLEGGIDCINDRDMYVLEGCAWVVQLESMDFSFGRSAGLPVPASLSHLLAVQKQELGPIIAATQRKDMPRATGANGYLTNNDYTREQEFFDATRLALARFANAALYNALYKKPKKLKG